MGVLFLVLIAVGILLSPDLRSNPVALLIAAFIFLGAVGLAYGKWLDIRSKQAMIDNERNTRR